MSDFHDQILAGIPSVLPDMPATAPGTSHAPERPRCLSPREMELAVKNALRYFPAHLHAQPARVRSQ